MYRNSLLKQTVIFIIGSIINIGMFCLSKYAGFPFWADYAGSVYITVLAGANFGIVSILLHAMLTVLLIDKWYALWYTLAALGTCTVMFIFRKREHRLGIRNVCSGAFMSAAISFGTVWLSLLTSGAHGRRAWLAAYLPDNLAVCLCSAGIGLIEGALTIAVFYILFLLTPKTDDKLIFKR